MRSEKLIKNGFTGIILQFATIILAFISRKLFLFYLGIEYAGANGLFTNVLSLLSLSELGFSTAIVYHLYKPLKEKDHEKIAALMTFYRDVYRLVAIAITVIGCALSFFVPLFVKDSSFSDNFLRIIYFGFLFQTVSSYFFSYKFSLINAQQDNYRFFWVDFIFRFVLVGVNIFNICITRDYITYLLGQIAVNLINNIVKSFMIDRQYPFLKHRCSITKEERRDIFSDVKNIFIGRLSSMVLNSTDNLVISFFLGLKNVGMYDNYASIQARVMNLINSMTRSLPNALSSTAVNESQAYTKSILKKATEVFFIIASFTSISLCCLSSKLISLWYGKKYEVAVLIVFLLSFSFFIQIIKTPLWYVLMGTGLFDKDKYISLIGATINLVVSIGLVLWIGLPGVIIGTIISQGLQFVLKSRLLFHTFFRENQKPYLLVVMKGLIIYVLELSVCYGACKGIELFKLSRIIDFGLDILLCLVIPNLLSYLYYRKTEGYQYVLQLLKKYRRKKVIKNV